MKIEIKSTKEKLIKREDITFICKNLNLVEEKLKLDLEKMNILTVGAWKNNILIGFATGGSNSNNVVYIEEMFINDFYIRDGLGSMIVSKLLNELSCDHFVLRKKFYCYL